MPPAYSIVEPRTSLQPSVILTTQFLASIVFANITTQSDMGSKPKKVDWPPTVRDYVRRAFEPHSAIPSVPSEEMQDKLRKTISYYAERNALNTIDWSTYPLPQQLILEERKQSGFVSPTAGMHELHLTHANGSTNSHLSAQMNTHMKKRKSQDSDELAPQSQATLPPWRRTNLESRMTFSDKRQKKGLAGDVTSKSEQSELEKRRQRFNIGKPGSNTASHNGDNDRPTGPVVGTNTALEKSYFRLTAPPNAETVRPLHILEQTLAMLTKKWRAEKNYNYICNQFKSLRQDLTVQHIKNAFTVKVYEIHARISLEKGDTGEYNQCQTQLKALYAQNLGGNPAEFTAYRILYFVYTCNKTDMNDMLAELTPADKSHEWIKHALDVRSSLALGNYHRFFKLYLQAPNMGGYLMDMFIERERLAALANMQKGYVRAFICAHRLLNMDSFPAVTLQFITDELGFDDNHVCREFLESHNGQNFIEPKGDGNYRVKMREAGNHFELLRAAAFSKVDIKGQI